MLLVFPSIWLLLAQSNSLWSEVFVISIQDHQFKHFKCRSHHPSLTILSYILIVRSHTLYFHDVEFLVINSCQSRSGIVVLSPKITEVSIRENSSTVLYLHDKLVSHHHFQDLQASALETGNYLLDHTVFVREGFVSRGWQDSDEALSVTVFALHTEVSCSMLFLQRYFISAADSHFLGELLVAGGALDGYQPDVLLPDFDIFDVLSPGEEHQVKVRHIWIQLLSKKGNSQSKLWQDSFHSLQENEPSTKHEEEALRWGPAFFWLILVLIYKKLASPLFLYNMMRLKCPPKTTGAIYI